ncbi:MAG: ribbon-helix-helix protein, CopG family [Planctomycetes bacterium]|nr:ribbon-helix-helix protein, CopG family [Planctomycetota bacterium]
MIRTQIQLPEGEYKELREAAARQRRSMAACIREGIQLFLSRFRSRRDDPIDIAGKFRPLPAKDLKPHDRWLADAIRDSKRRTRLRS